MYISWQLLGHSWQSLLNSSPTAADVLQVPAPTTDSAEEATAENGVPEGTEQAPPAPREKEQALIQDADEVHPAPPVNDAFMLYCLSIQCKAMYSQPVYHCHARLKVSVPASIAAERTAKGALADEYTGAVCTGDEVLEEGAQMGACCPAAGSGSPQGLRRGACQPACGDPQPLRLLL